VRRVARWSTAIAVVVLAVLGVGVLAAGATTVSAVSAVALAAQQYSHECHSTPLLDAEHSAASPVRSSAEEPHIVEPALSPSVVRSARMSSPPPGSLPPGLATLSRATHADLQVFRI